VTETLQDWQFSFLKTTTTDGSSFPLYPGHNFFTYIFTFNEGIRPPPKRKCVVLLNHYQIIIISYDALSKRLAHYIVVELSFAWPESIATILNVNSQ
jgi:hypothetical protein